ncbi:energy-coupled thiamine transporter ThiT [Priestia filamentosa]|uniref:energy-coupled thiamine transporter ThiT n=1 Tax=Priestia filamentosa TaxID=1402861 RepID=UPI0002DC9E56|nr:energy-coupled thiamine transporter ThiT [Priestia filamentosa]
MQRGRTLVLAEISIMTALAFLLDIVAQFFSLPQGGAISISMVPVLIVAFRHGIKGGLASGFLLGLLQVIVGPSQIYTPVQGLIDYLIAFTVIGFAGLTRKGIISSLTNNHTGKVILYVVLGSFAGSFLRYLAHCVSGYFFFAVYAPKDVPLLWYTIVYNSTYMIPAFVLSTIVTCLILISSKRLFI